MFCDKYLYSDTSMTYIGQKISCYTTLAYNYAELRVDMIKGVCVLHHVNHT